MRLLSVHLERFRLHADSLIEFPPEGITGLISANEGGKTTVVEAVTWAIYGAAALRGTAKSIRWNRSPASRKASVTLRLAIGERVLRVERTESSAKVYDERDETCIADGVAPANQFMPTVIGMGLNEFASSVLCQQKDVARLATMKPTERVTFIRRMLGLEQIDRALKEIRVEKASLAIELDGLQAGLGERGPLEEAYQGSLDGLELALAARMDAEDAEKQGRRLHAAAVDRVQHSRGDRTLHEKAAAALEATQAERDRQATTVRQLEADLQAQRAAAARIVDAEAALARLPALRAEDAALVRAHAEASERATIDKRVRDLIPEIAVLRERIRDGERQVAAHDEAAYVANQQAWDAANARLTALRAAREAERQEALATTRAEATEIARAAARIGALDKLGADSPCPTCAQVMGERFAAVRASMDEDRRRHEAVAAVASSTAAALAAPDDEEVEAEVALGAAMDEAKVLTERKQSWRLGTANLERDRPALAKATVDLKAAQNRLGQLSAVHYDADRAAAVQKEIAALERSERAIAADRGLAAMVTLTERKQEQARHAAVLAEQAVADAQKVLEGYPFDPDAHARLEAEVEAAQEALTAARVALGRAEQAEQGARDRLAAAETALADYDSRAVRMREVQAAHLTHARADARMDAFRVAVASRIRPELEELTSGFVNLLTDGRHESVALDEEFGMTLHESGVPVEVVSGGTEDIAALALRLALSQLIARRAGHPLECLILDEPFGSLDETRRGNVLALIRRLRGVFRQVLVISHIAETRDAVDHVIELEHDEVAGCSRVVGALATAGAD